MDWRYDLVEDVYVIIKAPQLRIHIRKYFVPNGEWTLHPTKRGVTMSLYEWKELKKTIPLFEDRGPELRTMDNKEAELELKVNNKILNLISVLVIITSKETSSSSTTTTKALKFHPKHATNKNKTKHIMKISHISFI